MNEKRGEKVKRKIGVTLYLSLASDRQTGQLSTVATAVAVIQVVAVLPSSVVGNWAVVVVVMPKGAVTKPFLQPRPSRSDRSIRWIDRQLPTPSPNHRHLPILFLLIHLFTPLWA